MLFILFAYPLMSSTGYSQEIFSEFFESNSLANWTSTGTWATGASVLNGTYSAICAGGGGTLGYQNISNITSLVGYNGTANTLNMSFSVTINNADAGEGFRFWYYNGSVWNNSNSTVSASGNTDFVYINYTVLIPRANQSTFQMRFACNVSASATEDCNVDNIRVIGAQLGVLQDTTPPNIMDWKWNVTNASNYSSTQGYQFNATVTDTTGISYVWVEQNFTGTLVNTTVTSCGTNIYCYNVSPLEANPISYYMKWWANDSSANHNLNNSDYVHYYQVNKSYIPITLYINGTNGDKTANNASTGNFTANFSASYSFNITLYTNLTGTMVLWDGQNSPLRNYTLLNQYVARSGYLIIANFSNANFTYAQANHSLSLNESNQPNINNWKWNVTNATNYSSTQGYQFNATIVDPNLDKVWIEHNFSGVLVNYSVATVVGNEYSYTNQTLGANLISYYMKWYANDTYGNTNTTDSVHYYQVNKSVGSVTLKLNGTLGDITMFYGTKTNASGATPYGTLKLYRNGSDVTSENDTYVTLAVGYYNYTASSLGNQNYTAVNLSRFVTVNKANQILTLTPSPSSIIVYGTSLTMTGAGNSSLANLYKNETLMTNPFNGILAVGDYNFTWNTTGNENYSANSTSIIATVNKAQSFSSLILIPVSPIIYGTVGNWSCSLNVSFMPSLYRNETDISAENNLDIVRGAGDYLVNCSWLGNENYTGSENSSVYAVNQASQSLMLTADPSTAITYGTSLTMTGSGNQTSAELYRNGTLISNPYMETLGAGDYNFTWSSAGNENYSANSTSVAVSVSKASSMANLVLVPASPMVYGATSNFSCSLNVSGTPVLLINGSDMSAQNGLNIVRGAGIYLVNCTWAGNENYTGNENSSFYTIDKANLSIVLYINGNDGDMALVNDSDANFTVYANYSPPTGYSLGFNSSVALYKMNETSGDLIDSSDGNFIGNIIEYGAVPSQTGHILGSRGIYDSSNYFLKNVDSYGGLDSWTISLWFKPTVDVPNDNQQWFHSNGATYSLGYGIRWNLGGAQFQTSKIGNPVTCDLLQTMTLSSAKWYLVVGAYNATTGNCSLWINDTFVFSSMPATNDAEKTGQVITVGSNQGIVEFASEFYIEQVALWNFSLTQADIDWLYNDGAGRDYSQPAPPSIPLYLYTNLSGTMQLWDNGSSPQFTNITALSQYPSGSYFIKANWSGDANYNPSEDSHILNLTIFNYPLNITSYKVNVTSGNDYTVGQGYEFNATIADANGIDSVWFESNFSGALVNYTVLAHDGDEYYYDYGQLGAGYYGYKWFANDTIGNLNDSEPVQYYLINRSASSVVLDVAPSSPIIYGTASNFSCSLNVSFQPSLYRNLTDITAENNVFVVRPVGTYLVNCTWAGNENYTGSEQTTVYVINNEVVPPTIGSLKVNVTNGGNYTFGQGYQFNATVADASGISYVWIEANFTGILVNTTVATNVSAEYYFNAGVLGVGNYSYKWYANDTVGNVNNSMPAQTYQVKTGYLPIQLLINGVDGDVSAYNNTGTVLNFTVQLGQPFNVSIYTNLNGSMILWAYGESPLMNYTNANDSIAGTYTILANWSGNANYSSSNASHLLYLTVYVPPVPSPVVLSVVTDKPSYLPSVNMSFTIYTNQTNTTYRIIAENGTVLFSSPPINGTGVFKFNWVSPPLTGAYLISAQAGNTTADRPFYVYKGFWDIPFEPLVLLMAGIIAFIIAYLFFWR
jgi:hypothetical protein